MGYSSWGQKELETTEPLTFSLSLIYLAVLGLSCGMQA